MKTGEGSLQGLSQPYDPNKTWRCSWQNQHGSSGGLEHCLSLIASYIQSDNKTVDQVRKQCLSEGWAKGHWWSVAYGDW